MQSGDIIDLMKKEALNRSKLAATLGISRDYLRKMLNNKALIPPWFGLAAAAIVYDLPPWPWSNPPEKKENSP